MVGCGRQAIERSTTAETDNVENEYVTRLEPGRDQLPYPTPERSHPPDCFLGIRRDLSRIVSAMSSVLLGLAIASTPRANIEGLPSRLFETGLRLPFENVSHALSFARQGRKPKHVVPLLR